MVAFWPEADPGRSVTDRGSTVEAFVLLTCWLLSRDSPEGASDIAPGWRGSSDTPRGPRPGVISKRFAYPLVTFWFEIHRSSPPSDGAVGDDCRASSSTGAEALQIERDARAKVQDNSAAGIRHREGAAASSTEAVLGGSM